MLNIRFYFQDYVHIDKDIWFTSGDYNGLYKYNLEEKRTELVAVFPHEPYYQFGLFLKMCQYKKNLIFVPQYSKRIYIFNIDNGFLTNIKIPKLTEALQPPYFCEAVVYDNCLYMMGAKYPGIVKINLEDYSAVIIDQWVKELQNEANFDMRGIWLGMEGVLENNRFLIPCYQCNRILELDLCTNEFRFYEVGSKKNRYARMIKAGNIFILVTHDEKNGCCVVFYEPLKKCCEEVQCNMQAYVDRFVIEYLNGIWILSPVSNEICCIKLSDREVSCYSIIGSERSDIVFARVVNEELFFCDCYTQAWYKINNLGLIEKIETNIIDAQNIIEIEQRIISQKMQDYFTGEYVSYPFSVWMKQIINQNSFPKKFNQIENVGKTIYEDTGGC